MKKLGIFWILMILLSIIFAGYFCGCNEGRKVTNPDEFKDYNCIVIDSCEYILYAGAYGFLEVTHKGNCKYCEKRRKDDVDWIRNYVRELRNMK